MIMKNLKGKADASITIFLTLVFGVLLAVVTAAFENVRFLSAEAYLRSSAEAAVVSVFGDYNRELYLSYGLLGIGGCDGSGLDDLCRAIRTDINHNLRTAPEESVSERTGRMGSETFTSLYRIGETAVEIVKAEDVTEQSAFYGQLEAYLRTGLLSDFAQEIKNMYLKMGEAEPGKAIHESLDLTGQYEHGEFDAPEKAETVPAQNSSGLGQEDSDTEPQVSPMQNHAGGNPLESFRKLLRDGALDLVCDSGKLSEETISTVYSERKEDGKADDDSGKLGTADLLKSLLDDKEEVFHSPLEITKKRSMMVSYAQQVFSCYTNPGTQHYKYGLEYLVSGSEQERDNLQGVVRRLLVLRTALNYAYVHSDAGLQAQSLATATEIAGAVGLPALITAIQKTILLILSVEESCVDIAALLEGNYVPVFKDAASFKMTYPEICSVNKTVFRTKARQYSGHSKTGDPRIFNYQKYLMLFLMMTPEKTMRLRLYDLIQDDLQIRCNATFSLEQCVNGIQYRVSYQMPFLWERFLPQNQRNSISRRYFDASHCYR